MLNATGATNNSVTPAVQTPPAPTGTVEVNTNIQVPPSGTDVTSLGSTEPGLTDPFQTQPQVGAPALGGGPITDMTGANMTGENQLLEAPAGVPVSDGTQAPPAPVGGAAPAGGAQAGPQAGAAPAGGTQGGGGDLTQIIQLAYQKGQTDGATATLQALTSGLGGGAGATPPAPAGAGAIG